MLTDGVKLGTCMNAIPSVMECIIYTNKQQAAKQQK
jgi:hypothetical protein